MSAETVSQKPTQLRWKIAAGILFLAGLAQAGAWHWYGASEDRSTQIQSVYSIWVSVTLLMLLWWAFGSGLRWRTRGLGVVAVVMAVALFLLVFRFDGYWGDFVPRFSFRWSPTPAARAEQYWDSQPKGIPAPIQGIDAPALPNDPVAAVNASSDETFEISEGDWPQFRGPARDGILRGVRIRRDWDVNPPQELWRHPVGLGWSSFAVVGRRAFTQEQRRDEEVVVCYDVQTGEQLWVHSDTVRFLSVMGGDGPRATPTVFDRRLYALGATGLLNCLDPLTGARLWQRNILDDAETENRHWGMAGSPLVVDNLIIVNPGGLKQGKSVIAYDRVTGNVVWAAGQRQSSYVAPRLESIGGTPQILIYGNDPLAGHDPATGKELWSFPWVNSTSNNAAQPILVDRNLVFVSSGYGRGSALIEVKQDGPRWSAKKTRWKTNSRFRLKFNGGVLKAGHVYGLNEGILACFDLETGKHKWKRGRYSFGQVLLIDDVLLVSSETGEIALVEATPKAYHEIARFQAIEGKTWNHPVVTRGLLLIRNGQEAACYDLRPASGSRGGD